MRQILVSIVGIMVASVATSAVWVGGSTLFFPLTSIDVAVGRRVFRDRCASCHSVTSDRVSTFGPSLANIGAEAHDRQTRVSAEQFLLESIIEPAAFRLAGTAGVMPVDSAAGLRSDEVVSLVAYLSTLGDKPRPDRLVNLVAKVQPVESPSPTAIDLAKVERGRALFTSKSDCLKCHSLRDLPGDSLLSPSLLRAGQHSAEYLREAVVDPAKEITPGYESTTLLLATGKVVTGRVVARSDDFLELAVATDAGVRVERIDIADIEPLDDDEDELGAPQSAMPTNYQSVLTPDEIDDLVSFLRSLRY